MEASSQNGIQCQGNPTAKCTGNALVKLKFSPIKGRATMHATNIPISQMWLSDAIVTMTKVNWLQVVEIMDILSEPPKISLIKNPKSELENNT